MAESTVQAQLDVRDVEIEIANPVVLVIRHPDVSDQIELFGLPDNVRVEYLDLGSSFDIGHRDRLSRIAAAEWVEGHVMSQLELPDGHGAKVAIQDVISQVCEAFGLELDGSFAADHPDWGKAEDAFLWR
jgi:hypothetical protein